MTFRPIPCKSWVRPPGSTHAEDGGIPVITLRPEASAPNALLVPLVPGIEAVVRAHLAAKPKPAKKKGRAK